MINWLDLLRVVTPVVSALAQAIIEGSRAAGVTHETVALTVAKSVQHFLNGAAPPRPPAPPA